MIFKNLNRQINQKMSLSNQISNYIDNIMDNYMNSISEKYSIDRLELQQLWSGGLSRPSNVPVKKSEKGAPTLSVDTDDLSLERLMKCTRVELAGLCKSRGVKCGGKKDELIARLQELDTKPVPKPVTTKTASKVESKSESKTTAKTEAKHKPLDILKTISNNIVPVHVRTNDFGNVVHPPTKLVFNTKTKRVIGHQEDDGSVSELCDEDIENCKKFKFQYDTPQNLDKKASLGGVKVQELEEDDDVDVEEEVLDVEEVEEEVEEEEEVEQDEEVEEEVEEDA